MLRLGLSHLRYLKFKHGFLDSINPICSYGFDIETICHFLFHCPNFLNERSLLLNNFSRITKDKLLSYDNSVIKLFLYGNDVVMIHWILLTNTLILNPSGDFILSS